MLSRTIGHPKVAQAIMRHSTVELTLGRYSHVYAGQVDKAIANFPDLNLPSQERKDKATGTEGEIVTAAKKLESNLALYLALPRGKKRISADSDGQKEAKLHRENDDPKHVPDKQISGNLGRKPPLPKVGIEPTLCCQNGILNPARLPIPPLRLMLT